MTKTVRKKTKVAPQKPVVTSQKPELLQEKKVIASPPVFGSTEEKVAHYLNQFGPVAQKEMEAYKIPASITLAQGLLESGFGVGRLAVEGNNHFGIKCHSQWNGERIYHDDDEKGECFRVYKDAASSYRDHSLFLANRQRYAFLFRLGKKDYKAWARGLKKAGYATDPQYPSKLVRLIERYDLTRFDKGKEVPATPIATKPVKAKNQSRYIVKKGDTLYGIARKLGIDITELKRLNSIQENKIYLGQELLLPNKK